MSQAILLTGATGYVGGRLLRALEGSSDSLRCLARRPRELLGRVRPGTEVVGGDAVSGEGLREALSGIDTAYYLIHSMGEGDDFEEQDRRAATNFAAAARAAGVSRIVYLGGLADESHELSAHLRSRIEVGRLLGATGVPVVELRASIVIGSGSLSFEMIRALVERLPVMVMPRWVSMLAQPIAIDDLLAYLLEARSIAPSLASVYEIGGADAMSYGDVMREYAHQRRLRRVMIRVPILTPRLSSLWLALVTPLYARVGRKLIDSICHPTVVRIDAAEKVFRVRPRGVRQAIATALANEKTEVEASRGSDSRSAIGRPRPLGSRVGRQRVDCREIHVPLPPEDLFRAVRRIGGKTGWYAYDSLWRLRGVLDLMFGGPGLKRSRRDPDQLVVGDVLDCWSVEAIEPGRLLRLRAEMRLPGRATLAFEVTPAPGGSRLRQTAVFDPRGLAGLAYWYGIYPLHALVFEGMLRGIANAARTTAARPPLASREKAA